MRGAFLLALGWLYQTKTPAFAGVLYARAVTLEDLDLLDRVLFDLTEADG